MQHLQAMNSPCGEDRESDHIYTREELKGMKRDDLRKLYKSKGVSSKGKKEDYINRFMTAQVAGFPSKQPPKTAKERKRKQIANETSKKRRERQANDAKQHAQVRAVKRAAGIQPTLDNMISDVPGVDYDFEAYTEDPIVARQLFGVNSGGWAEFDSKRLIAFVHVMNRLLDRRDASAIHKMNGLLELSIERYEMFTKTTEQVFTMDDLYSALDYRHQVKNDSREMNFEEAVLEWYATNDTISLEDRKARLPVEWVFDNHKEKRPLAWLKSLAGLRLSTSHGIFILDRVDFSAEDGKYYICKYDDEDDNKKDYPMTYYNVVEYADHEQPGFSQFHLPKEPLCVHVDGEFRARCDTTLQELRGVHSSMSADCYLEKAKILCNHAMREVGVYIDTHLVTAERAQDLILKYYRSQGIGVSWAPDEKDRVPAQLLTCACCGLRGMNNKRTNRSFCKVDLSNANIQRVLKLRDEVDDKVKDGDTDSDGINNGGGDGKVKPRWWTLQDHRQAMKMVPLSIPYNDDGDSKEVETWRLNSVWPAKKPEELVADKDKLPDYMIGKDGEPVYYHLHPEFVDEEFVSGELKKRYTAIICSECKNSLDAGEIPRRSIVAGVDFGDAKRIGLEPLTDRERQIISKVRHYLLVIKIESNIDYNRTKEKGQSAVKGCGIYFDDDSPQVVSDLLSHEGINGDVTLQLVGPDGEYDTLAKKIFGSANVHGRAWVIYQWLKVLREVNFHYQDDDELPDFDEVKAILKKANNSLVENAEHVNDEVVLRETEIAKDDARHIRTTGGDTSEDDQVGSGSSDFPLRCSFITSGSKGNEDVDRDFINRAAKVLDVNKEQGGDTKAISRRERSPLNDYENGDVTLAKASPDVFIFGTAYGKGPTLNTFESEHLLMQYTASAASNRPLIFHLFESKWRHGVIGSMHAKVSSNQEGFNLFAGEFSTDEFPKYVMKKLVPILNYAGRNSAFGALERNESAGQILALGRRYGCAPAFDTLGIDDVNHPLSIRFALPSSSNHNFPAVVSTASQIEMRRGIKLKEGCEGIPFNWNDRFQVMINNPVGAAKAYIDVVDDIMTILNGIKPSHRTTKTELKSQDDVGITGSSRAFFGKTETTGSGSLHFHVVKWGGISPELLESVADIPELCKKVAVVLDSMYSAKLNRHEHVQDLVQKNMRYVKSTKTKRLAVDSTSSSAQDFTENTSIGDMASSSPSKSNTAQDKDTNTNDSDSDSDVHMKEEVSHLVSQDTNLVQDTSDGSDVCAASFNAKSPSLVDMSKPFAFATLKSCHTKPQDNQDTSVDTSVASQDTSASPSNKPIVLSQDTSSDEDSVTNNSTPQARSKGPLPRAMMEAPDPKGEPEKFKTHVALTVCRCGIHTHSFTCKKPPKGWYGCRLCYMKALSNGGTKPIELMSIVEPDGSIGWIELDSLTHNFDERQADGTIRSVQQEYVGPYDPEKHTTKENIYPLRPDVTRTIIWELDRPELNPFEMLDTDNVTKDEIITSLYQQMIVDKPGRTPLMFEDGCEKISMDQIDLHQFSKQDKHNLFYALILGLIETSQLSPGEKSVEGLRKELMRRLIGKGYDCRLGDKSLTQHIESRVDQTGIAIEEKVKLYSRLMINVEGDGCFEGGELELGLFSESQNINVAVYEKVGDDLNRVESESYNTRGERDRPTIHLLRVKDTTSSQGLEIAATLKPPTYTYTLFTPKLKSIIDKLQDSDTKDLVMLYNLVAKGLPERNGWVVDFNPILAGLLGSNTNLLHLGSTEQSKSALYYIGPYINKDGVKITDALPILLKAYEHAQNFPSSAEDSGTNKRTVQHALTHAMNKLNALVEVSDTQAVSSLLRMKPSLCSDTFVTCDTEAYKKYVNGEIERQGKDMYGYDDDSSDTDEEKGYLSETDFLLGEESSEHLMKVEDDDTGLESDQSHLEDPMDVDEDTQDTPPVAVSDVMPKDSIELWDPFGDGSCMYWCFLEDTNQECTASNCAALRRDINIYISEHPNECIHPDIEGYTLSEWVLNNLKDITQRRGLVINEENPIMQYAQLMNIATPYDCEYGSALEACVFAVLMNRNVAIYDEASPEDSGHPLQMKKVISDDAPSTYLLYCNGRSHYKLMEMTSGRSRKRKKSSENLQYDDCNLLDPESKKRLAENRKMYDLNQREDNIEADMNYFNAEHGVAHVYRKDDGSKMPVSYPALYRFRGEGLKHLCRYHYTALVKVESSKKDDSSRIVDSKAAGRKKSKPFMFADGLDIGKYNYQVLRSKQLTPKFIKSPPHLPKIKPQPPDPEEYSDEDEEYRDLMKKYKRELSAWKKKADKFAHFYLIMFRAEDELYQKGQDNTYKYDYEAFVEFYEQLICKSYFYIDDRLLLEQMERVMYSWRVDRGRREMLAAHRARARTKWSAAEKEAAKSYWGNRNTSTSCQQGDVGMDYITSVASDLSRKQKTNANKHLRNCRELMDTLKDLVKSSNEDSSYSTRAKRANVTKRPFDYILDESKRQKSSTNVEIVDDDVQRQPPMYRKIHDLDKKVDDFIESQDLSVDKDVVVKLVRNHFEAMQSGKALEDDYEPPNLLVCGKPGSGKSKIIETLDGIAEMMKVGQQMKCAYMGAAAVNIGGTTLLGPWNIPVFNKGEKISYLGWNLNKLQALKNRFDRNIHNICAVIVDEISTVQPYMLAYLNLRMQQMFGNDKPFGGRMIILLGDFEQKPPTSGSNLPAVVMQNIEEKGKPLTSKSVDNLNLAKMGGYLFTKFRYIKLTSQHRSGDPKHTAVINRMSDTGKISIGDLRTYKKLSGKDLDGDDFRFATILVTGNMERRKINAWQAKRYAQYHRVNVVRWARKRLENKWIGKPRTEECIAHAMRKSCFWELFVPGAKGFLNTYNINGDYGLANGTEIKYHSLSFGDRVEERQFDTLFTQAKPGEIIDLDSPPTAINVELFADFEEDTSATKAKKKAYRKEWLQSGKGSITNDGRVVIPISRQDGSQIKYDSTYVPGCDLIEEGLYYKDSQIEMKDHFPIEPAFSITIDKAQGKTIHRIILSISKHSFHLNKMTWEGLFVSLSRVRSGDHMRLLIKRGDWSTVRYVSELRQNKYTGMFFNGYTDHPDGDGSMIWDFSLAKKNAGFDRKIKFGGKTAKAKKRPRRESTYIGWNKKIHRGEGGTQTILDRG